MSSNTSPSRYIEPEDSYLSEANFKADINYRMRVPTKISMGNYDGEVPNGLNSQWSNNYSNINMQVPERILVAGGDQHIGIYISVRRFELFHLKSNLRSLFVYEFESLSAFNIL